MDAEGGCDSAQKKVIPKNLDLISETHVSEAEN